MNNRQSFRQNKGTMENTIKIYPNTDLYNRVLVEFIYIVDGNKFHKEVFLQPFKLQQILSPFISRGFMVNDLRYEERVQVEFNKKFGDHPEYKRMDGDFIRSAFDKSFNQKYS
jgi:hypothetical protein